MPYIKLADLSYPHTESSIRAENPQTSYPAFFPTPDGYAFVFATPQPVHNILTETIIETIPKLSVLNNYEQQWAIVPLSQESIDINISNKKSQLLDQVNSIFNTKKYLSVTFNTNAFNGGIESAQLAKSKADMLIYTAQKNNIALPVNCTFNDINNNPIQLTTDTLQDLAAVIGANYETMFQKKAKLRRDIALLQTVEAVSNFNVQEQWDLA